MLRSQLGMRALRVSPLVDERGVGVELVFKVVSGKPLAAREKVASCYMGAEEFRAMCHDGEVALGKVGVGCA